MREGLEVARYTKFEIVHSMTTIITNGGGIDRMVLILNFCTIYAQRQDILGVRDGE